MTGISVKPAPSNNTIENEEKTKNDVQSEVQKRERNWPAILFSIYLHLIAPWAIYVAFTEAYWATIFFTMFICLWSVLSITTGAHRLWAHRTYKADSKLKVLLMLGHTLAGTGTIYTWVQKHRVHHQHFETANDPYNPKKGFLYAHFLSNLEAESPTDEELAKQIDMSDIEKDKVVMFQKKYYWLLYIIITLLLPINAPAEYWGETILNTVLVTGILRLLITHHASWLVNSATLVWGIRPEDKSPSDSNLVFLISKSHWPMYHYLLSWDYQSGEFGTYGSGCSTTFIRIWAAMGWASELRTIDSETVKKAIGTAIETGLPIEVCLNNAATSENTRLPEEHYLDYEKYK